jgi:hypothetical protein
MSPPQFLIEDTVGENTAVSISRKKINPTEYGTKEGAWPEEYFNPESNMSYLLARKRSLSSLCSATPSSTPSDQKPREAKSTPYMRPRYETVLATKGSFVDKFDEGIGKASSSLCQTLLSSEHMYPQSSLFHNDLFNSTYQEIRNRNKAMII